MRLATPLMLATAALLAGCQFHASTSQGNAALNAEALVVYRDLIEGRNDAIVARMSSASNPAQVRAQLPMLKTMAGDCITSAPAVRGTQSMISNQGSTYTVAHAYECPDRMVEVSTTFIKQGETWKVHGFNVNATMAAPAAADAAPNAVPADPASPPATKEPAGTPT